MLGEHYENQMDSFMRVMDHNRADPLHRIAAKWCHSCHREFVVDKDLWICKNCDSGLELRLEMK